MAKWITRREAGKMAHTFECISMKMGKVIFHPKKNVCKCGRHGY